jgi:hypothetical protein
MAWSDYLGPINTQLAHITSGTLEAGTNTQLRADLLLVASGGTVAKTSGTGAVAMAVTYTATSAARLATVTVKFSAAPTTSENLTVTLDATAGAAYDVLLYSGDPSATSATSVVLSSTHWGEVWLVAGDKITVAYTNTDTRTYGVQITMMEVA